LVVGTNGRGGRGARAPPAKSNTLLDVGSVVKDPTPTKKGSAFARPAQNCRGSVPELIAAITAYLDQRNADPKPFVWTAWVRQILAKVKKANDTLATLH
jgi:hypothetical protein